MTYKIEYPTEKDFLEMDNYYLKEFGTPDKYLVEANLENDLKIQNLEINNIVCFKDNEKPIAWSIVLPTSRGSKTKFLNREITENQLFEDSINNQSFESLYIFAAIVLPNYRKRGFAKELARYQINYFKSTYKITDYFAWIFSPEGEKLIKSLESHNSIKIDYISKV